MSITLLGEPVEPSSCNAVAICSFVYFIVSHNVQESNFCPHPLKAPLFFVFYPNCLYADRLLCPKFYELFVNREKTPFLYDSYKYKESNVNNQLE